MSQHYPSWRYHRNGKAFLVNHPDLEPQGSDWAESPFRQPAPEPKLPECCAALKAKFDAAWEKLQTDHAEERKQFDAQWEEKVRECEDLQAQVNRLSTPAPAEPEAQPKSKKK